MSLAAGEAVEVVRDHGDGWIEVKKKSDGRIGCGEDDQVQFKYVDVSAPLVVGLGDSGGCGGGSVCMCLCLCFFLVMNDIVAIIQPPLVFIFIFVIASTTHPSISGIGASHIRQPTDLSSNSSSGGGGARSSRSRKGWGSSRGRWRHSFQRRRGNV